MSPPIQVSFVPRWPRNPYHEQLARELARLGAEVGSESRLKSIVVHGRATGEMPQIIHLHAPPPFRLGLKALCRFFRFWHRLHQLRRAGVKIVWTVHNETDHESAHPAIDRAVCRWLYRYVDAVILHSAAARSAIEANWGQPEQRRVSVVHHGHFIGCYPNELSRTDARAKLKLRDDELVFLFLGNIRPYKGVVPLVHDFKSVATPRMRLVIAGEPLTAALRHKIEQAIGDSPQILFHPAFVADDEVQTYLNGSDAVVFPYTKALTSGALILAMSFRKACIAPRMGAIADTLDEAGGFFYDPHAPGGLRRALAAAAAARTQLPMMGAHNRRRAESWGWDEAARLTLATYRACLEPNTRAAVRAGAFRRRPA